MRFVKRIRYIRGGLSREKFGDLFWGIHRNTVRAWEAGETMPKGEILALFFEQFNVNLNWLFLGKGESYLNGRDHKGVQD